MTSNLRRSPIKLIQLTDLHLYSQPGITLDWEENCKVDPEAGLQAVISQIRHRHADLDGVVVTGDLAQEPVKETYFRCAGLLDLPCPIWCLPGNHDDEHAMQAACGSGRLQMPSMVNLGNWQILLINSVSPYGNWGEIQGAEMDRLCWQLTQTAQDKTHLLLALHHPPVVLNSPWLDSLNLRHSDLLMEIIESVDSIKGMICGHVHHASQSLLGRIPVWTSPATCAQFMIPAEHFAFHPQSRPGYRVLILHDNGNIETNPEYVEPQ